MLHILRHDNEENGVIACKTLLDIVRSYRPLTDDSLSEFLSIFQEAFQNMSGLVEQILSDDSPLLDPNVMLPGIRSFKVLGEMGMVMVIMSQFHRPMVSAPVQTTITPAFEVLALEAPAQKKAREDYEAMGGIWAGMAPSIKNASAYSDFIHTQIKVCFSVLVVCILLLKTHQMLSYLAFVMRVLGETDESYGQTLTLSALRMLQDCPTNGISLRKVRLF